MRRWLWLVPVVWLLVPERLWWKLLLWRRWWLVRRWFRLWLLQVRWWWLQLWSWFLVEWLSWLLWFEGCRSSIRSSVAHRDDRNRM